jgi:glucose/arabinose dehydrogenase
MRRAFLASLLLLAAGAPASAAPYDQMDYGPFLSATYVAPWPAGNVAYRGVAVPLDGPTTTAKAAYIFDTEMLRPMAAWTGQFINYKGVAFDGGHGANPGPDPKKTTQIFSTKPSPGWARAGDLKDPRSTIFGILPADWARFKGIHRTDAGVVFSYTVGRMQVLEMSTLEKRNDQAVFCRALSAGPSDQAQLMVVADVVDATGTDSGKALVVHKGTDDLLVAVQGGPDGTKLEVLDKTRVVLHLPAHLEQVNFKVCLWSGPAAQSAKVAELLPQFGPAADLRPLTKGGKARFTETVTLAGKRGDDKAAYVIDTLPVPFNNPYKSWMRLGGLDLFSDGRAALTTWSGDVWIVSGIDNDLQKVTWKRFASGLFQPLGLKIVDDTIYVLCRDGVYKLIDTNGDGEADYYQCFNNDFLVTSNFHEFIFDLHTDKEGNFYFIKSGPVRPGGRGWDKVTTSHGCLFKVSKDGSKIEVVARGFRAPNGMGVGPNGELTTGDNEGTWMPMCPINWIKQDGFYGVPDFANRPVKPTVRDNPLCWMPKEVDNSGGCQVWITGDKFGPLSGQLLHTSYGTCTLFNVLKEEVGGQKQGGVVPVLKFDTGVMRARFVERQNALYLAGLRGWQTTATKDAGFYRVRYTGRPAGLAVEMHVLPGQVKLTFSEPLDKKAAENVDNYSVQRWNYRWKEDYGSPHFKVSNPKQQGHDDMDVESASLSADGKTVTLKLVDLKPVMQMKIAYQLKAADGAPVRSAIHSTINVVGDQVGEVHVGEYRIVPRKQ